MDIGTQTLQLIVYDFDGVFTDNRVLVFEDGGEAVFCNRADGLAIDKIKKLGIPQIILSTEKNKVVKARAQKLNLDVIQGVDDKKATLIGYCKENNYDLQKTVYIGNGTNDLEAMSIVGYPVAPIDANDKIKNLAKIVVKKKVEIGSLKNFLKFF